MPTLWTKPFSTLSMCADDTIHQCNYKEAAASNPICDTVRSALDNAALICNEIIPAAQQHGSQASTTGVQQRRKTLVKQSLNRT